MKLDPRYLAGFIDADGSISISKYRSPTSVHIRYQPRVTMTNCDRSVLDATCAQYGGGVYVHHAKTAKHRETFSWIAVSRPAIVFLRAVYPYLIVKKAQADIAFQLQDNINKYNHKLGGGAGPSKVQWLAPERDAVMEERQRLSDEIKRLKRV